MLETDCMTKVGRCGVTLTAGNLVIITDPWQTQAIEKQAEDRSRSKESKSTPSAVSMVVLVHKNVANEAYCFAARYGLHARREAR